MREHRGQTAVEVSPTLVAQLRRLARARARQRPISWLAAQRIATKQGAMLARVANEAGIRPEDLVAGLPRIQVKLDSKLPVSGITFWDRDRGCWTIRVRASDDAARRRFTILHEFKHALDHPFSAVLYDPRYLQGAAQAEMAADAFANTTLMPSQLVRRLVQVDGLSIGRLARRLHVSCDRAALRLSDLNLSEPITSPKGEHQ